MFLRVSPGDHEERLIAEINITPLTDVFMVLLVIFLVAAPLMIQSAIRVNLPEVTSREEAPTPTSVLVTVTKTGLYYFNEEQVENLAKIEERVRHTLENAPSRLIIINADRAVLHGRVVELIDRVKQAGAQRLAIGIEEK